MTVDRKGSCDQTIDIAHSPKENALNHQDMRKECSSCPTVSWTVWEGHSDVILPSSLLLRSWNLMPEFKGIRQDSEFLFDTSIDLSCFRHHIVLLRFAQT